MNSLDRRDFLLSLSAAIAGLGAASLSGQTQKASAGTEIIGQGKYQWKVVPDWGVLDSATPVNDCHGMIQGTDGNIHLLTNHTRNNIITYDRSGSLVTKGGTAFPGAHGFTLDRKDGQDVFYITDQNLHQFFLTKTDGTILRTWDYPEESGKYKGREEFKPTHVALSPDGGFYVVDGYGQNWCHRYDAAGKWKSCFGGDQPGGANLACAHGAWVDTRDGKNLIWITSRSESKIKRYTMDGELVDIMEFPGAEPNFIVPFGDHTIIPCLTGNGGEADAPRNGFLIVLGPDRKVIANLGAAAPVYQEGKLQKLGCNTSLFTYPHGMLIDDQESIYVAQWNSGRTYPVKLERLKA